MDRPAAECGILPDRREPGQPATAFGVGRPLCFAWEVYAVTRFTSMRIGRGEPPDLPPVGPVTPAVEGLVVLAMVWLIVQLWRSLRAARVAGADPGHGFTAVSMSARPADRELP